MVWCGGFRNYLYIIRYWRLGFDRAANREIAVAKCQNRLRGEADVRRSQVSAGLTAECPLMSQVATHANVTLSVSRIVAVQIKHKTHRRRDKSSALGIEDLGFGNRDRELLGH